MKNKALLVTTIVFFIVVNTGYYWEIFLGSWTMLIVLFLGLVFIALVIGLVYQLVLLIAAKFKDRSRSILVVLMTIVLALTVYSPGGLIDFEQFEGEDLLVAGREGAANCTTVLKLKRDHTFRERSVCFGVTIITGDYSIKGDTIRFENISFGETYHQYALIKSTVLKNNVISKELLLYHDINDTLPYSLYLSTNKLIQ